MMKKQSNTQKHASKPAGWTYPLALLLFLAGWQLLVFLFKFPAFILPSPLQVGQRFLTACNDGSLLRHLLATLTEMLSGLAIGIFSATLLGYLLSKSKFLERVLSPFLVASQAVPVAAIAPLLIIWFGSGVLSKVLICSLTVFFPMLVNTLIGLHAVPAAMRDLMTTLHATRWQTFTRLEMPASLPVLLGGMRVSATLSVIGAVVGELAGADKGLGFLINVGRGQYDTALVFVAVFTLVFLALILYGSVLLLEKRLLRWQEAK
ncbi:MAG: ABC transporter permease [Pelolinea sp.]|nr:ABC transporter permease [Pelolinea sp.]